MYKKAMVIDDNAIDLVIARRVINNFKFAAEVVTMGSAKEALTYIQENADNSLPDIIFLDINMPEINGFEFLQSFDKFPKKLKNACKIVMLSTSIHPDERQKANNDPNVGYFLNKPLSEEKLKEVVTAL